MICPPGFHIEEICVEDPAPVPGPVWTDLGIVPAVAQSPTPLARRICQLTPFAGKVYLGYGDWDDTKQPGCDLIAWDTQAGAFITLTHVTTDALWCNRIVDGELWAIVTDPEVGADPDAVVVKADGSFRVITGDPGPTPYAWHLFDAVKFRGEYFLFGADRSKGESVSWATGWVYRKRPDPRTDWWWPVHYTRSTAMRMYAAFVLNDNLWAIGSDGKVDRFDGKVDQFDKPIWTRMPFNFPTVTTKPQPYQNGYIMRGFWPAYGAGPLIYFDGVKVTTMGAVQDHHVDNGDLWTLKNFGIYRGEDRIADAPAGSYSLCVLDGAVFVGTGDSHVWRFA